MMNSIGVDLHKKTIMARVVSPDRRLLATQCFDCSQTDLLAAWFQNQRPFQVTVEATASYEWFLQLVEPLAERVVLANPGRLRLIAETTRKTDKLDAGVLAEMLALDLIPPAHRPTPRQREHRTLVRHRDFLRRRQTVFERLAQRRGRRRAITAIARRLICVMTAVVARGQRYQPGGVPSRGRVALSAN
jgi:transposase